MYTLNLHYTSPETLKVFVKEKNLQKEKNILLQIFTAQNNIEYIKDLIDTVKILIPHIKIVGATTSGEIIEGKAQIDTTVLAFSVFEKTTIETHAVMGENSSKKTAESLIKQFSGKRNPKVAITFVDGLYSNGEIFMDVFDAYDHNLVVAGGLAGDNAQFQKTVVFTEKEIFIHGAVTALLYSESLQVVTKASFGWESVGKVMTVTRAQKNIVYAIDNQRTVEIYGKYLGEDIAKNLPQVGVEFPLIVKRDGMEIPRAPLRKNSDGSLVFAGNINEGERVSFGYGNLQAILHYGQQVYDDVEIQNSESIFVYSCMARVQLLGESINEELLPLQSICPVSGFFTYGEFFVNSPMHKHELLNETMTVLALSECKTSKDLSLPRYDYFKRSKGEQSLTLKALSHLVSQTSKELEEFNTVLKERVREEVIKNNRKDRVLLQQTKLAQMGEMISMIAHQWRQPLSSISTLSQTINLRVSMGVLDEETVLRLSDTITDTAMHLSQTIDDFREFFKPRKEKRETSFTEIVESVLSIIENSITTKNIKIVKELHNTEKFNSYPNEIKQVVLNLLKNAQDAFLEAEVAEPYILIRNYQENEKHILEICDNAGGVPEALKEKIFEPYFSTKKKKDGTGLGLYMSKTIIEEHCNGKLCVENCKDGAAFRIELPVLLEKENR